MTGVTKIAMTRDLFWQDWPTMRMEIQRRWPHLTNSDLEIIAGDRELLIVRIVERYGIAKDWAEKQVKQWENGDR